MGTFATVVRLLHDSLGWRVQFVGFAQRDVGASAMSPIIELGPPGASTISQSEDVITQPVTLDNGEAWGQLVCHRDGGVEFGSAGTHVLGVLARVIAAETDANLSRRAALDARRAVVQSIIDERSMTPVFQPVVDLRSKQVVGVEALSRFDQVEGSAYEWFERARAVGLDVELELVAASVALTRLDEVPCGLFVAINASPALILDDRFAALLEGVHRRIVVEITENRVIDAAESLDERLVALRRCGVRLAIDDAGAGYAGLQRLIELGPDIVKLDLSLIRGIDRDLARTALAEAMVGFCRATGALLVAEGIETNAELDRVSEIGIDLGQGYLLARPAPLPVQEIGTPLRDVSAS